MTEPQDSHGSTRPISVAELLARNGTIGAPPVGGRRRRRRGNTDSVTVAELTGEIPIVTDAHEDDVESDDVVDVEDEASFDEPHQEPHQAVAPTPTNGVGARATGRMPVPAPTEAEAEYDAHVEKRDVEAKPLTFTPPRRRPAAAPRTGGFTPAGRAEQMSPDPLIDDDESDDHLGLLDLEDVHEDDHDAPASDYEAAPTGSEAPSYRKSSSDTLFGGQSVADEQARRGRHPGPEDIDLGEEDDESVDVIDAGAPDKQGSPFVRGVWVVAQCMLAVAFGAGLFVAFDQLWKWNSIVALVLGVLVILGLVVGVRVVRKTEDIGSTLIAVAVGALVTIGPLALLQAH
jgi:hypothetical protein